MQINFTRTQLDFLIQEANKQNTTIEAYIQQLVDIQMEMQESLEADMTLDLWTDDEMMPKAY